MQKCEIQGLTIYDAFEKCIIEFEYPFRISEFREMAKELGLVFYCPSDPCIEDVNPKIKKFIEENSEMNVYELRDEIIIKFGVEVKVIKIKIIIRNYLIKKNASI